MEELVEEGRKFGEQIAKETYEPMRVVGRKKIK